MEKLEAFLRKYFPEESVAPFGIRETAEDTAIRLLSYTHMCREGRARSATLNGIMSCQVFFASRVVEWLQSGKLTPEEAAHELSETLDSMTKDALVQYVAEQEGEIAAPGASNNDPEFDPFHQKEQERIKKGVS